MPYRLTTFGCVTLQRDGVPLTGRATQRRRVALLVLLASSVPRGLSRETIIGRLWPDRAPDAARHALSQALYALRQELGSEAVLAGIDELRLNPDRISSDIAELWEAVAAGDHRRVAASRSGPFLDGFFVPDAPEFERWAEEERTRVDRALAASFEALATEAEAGGDASEAADWWRRRAALDRLDARIARRLMEALIAAGDRAGAVRHARVHAALLEAELQLPPDPEIEALALRAASGPPLRAGRPPGPAPRREREAAPDPHAPPEPEKPAEPRAPTRPSSAGPPDPAGRPRRWMWAVRTATATALPILLLLLTAVGVAVSRRAPAEADLPPRAVILASIRGTDESLALAVEEALRAELQSTPGLRLVPEGQLRETRRLMRQHPDAPVTMSVAVEAGQRLGVPLAVGGSVERLGSGLQLVAEVVDIGSGRVIATLAERPASDEEVIPAVVRLARELRERVSGAPADDDLNPLPAVSTASLPALKSYALARRRLARLEREAAIELAEAALVHDSLFALAHYLVADLLWYVDRNRHAREHMRRAFELSHALTPRERLAVRARYEELVQDRPDSALTYWRRLAVAHPEEALAWEGMRWVFRALARWEPMAAAAESAYARDPDLFPYFAEDRLRRLATRGDTAAAFALAEELAGRLAWDPAREIVYWWAVPRGEWERLLDVLSEKDHYRRQFVHLAAGRLEEGRRELERLRDVPWLQALPRALLLQARAELEEDGGRPEQARALAREALDWIRAADLSSPAYARLAERIADIGARTADRELVGEVEAFLRRQDGDRDLRSYALALRTVAACDAFAHGDMAAAARLAGEARPGMFYGRSTSTVLMLEADARRTAGDRAGADSLYSWLLGPAAFADAADGDDETLAVLRRYAARARAEREGS